MTGRPFEPRSIPDPRSGCVTELLGTAAVIAAFVAVPATTSWLRQFHRRWKTDARCFPQPFHRKSLTDPLASAQQHPSFWTADA